MSEDKEKWLNGWSRWKTNVFLGSSFHCAGCGKMKVMACVALTEDMSCPDKEPDWPFNQETCPLCEQFTELMFGPQDQLAARQRELTKKLALNKQVPTAWLYEPDFERFPQSTKGAPRLPLLRFEGYNQIMGYKFAEPLYKA